MSYIKRKSAKQESRTAKEFKGRTQPASGALAGAKGDVRTGVRNGSSFNEEDFLIENKFTDKDSYKLELKIWDKIALEALKDNFRTPLMQIDIQDLNIVVMDFNHYLTLVENDQRFTPNIQATKAKSIVLEKDSLFKCFSICRSEGLVYVRFIDFDKKRLVVMEKDIFLGL